MQPSWCPAAQTRSERFPSPQYSSLSPWGWTGTLSKGLNHADKGITSWHCYMLDTAPPHQGQMVICPHTSRNICLVEYNCCEVQDCISMCLLKETGSFNPGLSITATSLIKATYETLLVSQAPAGSFIARYHRMLQKRKKESKILIIPMKKLSWCPVTQRLSYSPVKWQKYRS